MNEFYVERPTKEEAIEIVERAIANGVECFDAVTGMDVDPEGGFYRHDNYECWGINTEHGTYTLNKESNWVTSATKLTMDEYRAKFPCDKYDGSSTESDGNKLPPIGWEGEALRNGEWLAGKVVYHCSYGSALFVDNGDTFAFWTKELRPLRTDRERFIESALAVKSAHMWTENEYLGAMYDAGFKAPDNLNDHD